MAIGEALRKMVACIEKVEAENKKLRAELEASRQRYQNLSPVNRTEVGRSCQTHDNLGCNTAGQCVDLAEYKRVMDQLAKNEQSYEKLVYAHEALKSKLQYTRKVFKEWQKWAEKWVLNDSKRRIKSTDQRDVSPISSVGYSRSSGVPSPPFIPKGIAPSISGSSRYTSPWVEGDDVQSLHRSPPRSKVGSPKLPDLPTQNTSSEVQVPTSGDLTEGSVETEAHSRTRNTDHASREQDVLDDDSPVILLERSTKRKKYIRRNPLDDREHSPVKIKNRSSSPLPALTHTWVRAPHDSLDLDDVGSHIHTPRKRRKLEQVRLGSSMACMTANQDENKVTYNLDGGAYNKIIEIKDEDDHHAIESRPSPLPFLQPTRDGEEQGEGAHQNEQHKPSTTAQQLPKSPSGNIYPTPVTERCLRHNPRHDRQDPKQKTLKGSPAVLQLTELNTRVLPRTNSRLSYSKSPKPQSRRDRGAAQVPALAEDGDHSPSASRKSKSKQSDTTVSNEKISKASDAHHRLGTLLRERSPEKTLLDPALKNAPPTKGPKRPHTPVSRPSRHESPKLAATPTTNLASIPVFGKSGQANRLNSRQDQEFEILSDQRPPSAHRNIKQATRKPLAREVPLIDRPPSDSKPEDEPLRIRPLNRLRTSDFKLNPANSNYAYHESVRKHEEKASISGCTDRNCPRCKDMRAFVENNGYARLPGEDPEESDHRLLLDHLGGDARRVEDLTLEEKKEFLLQAKEKQFADKFGKHKQRFGRAASPAGYWDVDFPTTQ